MVQLHAVAPTAGEYLPAAQAQGAGGAVPPVHVLPTGHSVQLHPASVAARAPAAKLPAAQVQGWG